MNHKYLKQGVEPEAPLMAAALEGHDAWQHFIAIPCCGEHLLLPRTLKSLEKLDKKGSLLVLLLLNESSNTPEEYRQSNQLCRQELHRDYPLLPLPKLPGGYLAKTDTYDLLVLEKLGTNDLGKKGGVGLARKLCADIGLALWSQKKLATPWIHNTDADSALLKDYLSTMEGVSTDHSAILHPFIHRRSEGNEDHWLAAALYETWLRYYRLGLSWAQSPYAFYTVGSTITINSKHYSMAHGFPRRQAGEDFYLLNKLSKLGAIKSLESSPIILQDRPSARVPFGTGQGTQKILSTTRQGYAYEVYHPLVFTLLKSYLTSSLQALRQSVSIGGQLPTEHRGYFADAFIIETDKALAGARQRSKSPEGAIQQFHHWFDAFRTLKLIHQLRDDHCGILPIADALRHSPFLDLKGREEGIENDLNFLREQEGLGSLAQYTTDAL